MSNFITRQSGLYHNLVIKIREGHFELTNFLTFLKLANLHQVLELILGLKQQLMEVFEFPRQVTVKGDSGARRNTKYYTYVVCGNIKRDTYM